MNKKLISRVLVTTLCSATALNPVPFFQGVVNTVVQAEEVSQTGEFEITSGCLLKYNGNAEKVVIPEGVTSIGGYAFEKNDVITEVVIPNSVSIINNGAFKECKKLKSIVCPSSLQEINEEVFMGCISLESVELPEGLTYISANAFNGCTSLKKVVLPTTLQRMGWSVFKGSTNLEEVVIPSSLSTFGGTTFEGTKWLENKKKENVLVIVNGTLLDATGSEGNVVVPEGVKRIEQEAFADCVNVKTVQLPESLETVKDKVFYNCSQLVTVCMPKGVKRFGKDVFLGCSNLKSIYGEPGTQAEKAANDKGVEFKNISEYVPVKPEEPKTEKEKLKKTYGDSEFTVALQQEEALNYESSKTSVAVVDQKGTVTIKGCGKSKITITNTVSGQVCKEIELTVSPKKPSLSVVKTSAKKVLKIKWKKDSKADGYEIYYGKNKNFTGKNTALIKSNKTTSKTIKKLKSGTKYYVKIRAYKNADGGKIQSSWSKVVSIKVK